ncbi:TraI domain-containing protein [Erwinia sp. OPT-41]|uniref:TraI domain-containing protein n=1 Tax=Erwinia plantamica TaxID=3237104 RepID=A0ABW7CL00_9GAMM
MLNKIKTFLSRTPPVTEPAGRLPVSVPTGYFSPVKAEGLVITALRQDALQKIRENNALSGEVYQRLYLAPVYYLLERTQNVPAAPDGRWAYAGGFGDLSLRFTAYAVRLARGYMFPPGAAPEEQAAQGVIWQAVIFWAALCYHLPLLASIEGETTGGVSWQPGISAPDAPYRFRFRHFPPNAHDASALSALAAGQLMPAEAINWLSGNSGALLSLACAFRNGSPDMPLIRTLLDQAAEKVDSPMMQKAAGESSVSVAAISVNTGIPQGEELSIQAVDNSTFTVVDSVVPELMTSLTDKYNGNIRPLLDMANEPEPQQVQPDNSVPATGKEDADMLLSLFSVEPGIEAPEPSDIKDSTVEDETAGHGEEACKMEDTSRNDHTDLPATREQRVHQVHAENERPTRGEQFLTWLAEGMAADRITVNQHDSRVHSVAGFIYLLVPDIFFIFLKETGSNCNREQIQISFEKLQLHRVRKGERFTRARLYSTEDKEGKFRNVNGYLIKANRLKGGKPPEDSRLLFFPQERQHTGVSTRKDS